jgi:hypothetical protein
LDDTFFFPLSLPSRYHYILSTIRNRILVPVEMVAISFRSIFLVNKRGGKSQWTNNLGKKEMKGLFLSSRRTSMLCINHIYQGSTSVCITLLSLILNNPSVCLTKSFQINNSDDECLSCWCK